MSDDENVIVGGSRTYHKSDCYYAGRVWDRNWTGYPALVSAAFSAALDGLAPCQSCKPPHDPDWDNLARRLDVIKRFEDIDVDLLARRLVVTRKIEDLDVAVIRRRAVQLLDRAFGPDSEKRALKARFLDLSRSGKIPIDVTNCLHMISDLRNMAEHGDELTELQAMIAGLCWVLVEDWSAART